MTSELFVAPLQQHQHQTRNGGHFLRSAHTPTLKAVYHVAATFHRSKCPEKSPPPPSTPDRIRNYSYLHNAGSFPLISPTS